MLNQWNNGKKELRDCFEGGQYHAWKSNRAEWQEANDPNNLISITPVDIDTEYYSYTYGIDEAQIKFKFTPLQGPIEQCQFSYGVFPISSDIHSLLESSDELSDRLGIASLLGNNLLKARCTFNPNHKNTVWLVQGALLI